MENSKMVGRQVVVNAIDAYIAVEKNAIVERLALISAVCARIPTGECVQVRDMQKVIEGSGRLHWLRHFRSMVAGGCTVASLRAEFSRLVFLAAVNPINGSSLVGMAFADAESRGVAGFGDWFEKRFGYAEEFDPFPASVEIEEPIDA